MKPAVPPPAANRTARPAAIPSCCFVQTISTIPLIHICVFIRNRVLSSIHENTILSHQTTGGTKITGEGGDLFHVRGSIDMALPGEFAGNCKSKLRSPL